MYGKKVAFLFLVVAIVVAAVAMVFRGISGEDTWICVGGSWEKHGNPSSAMPTSGCGDPVAPFNFDKTGNAMRGNPGLEPGSWYLSYEAPGKPALSAKLSFAAAATFAESLSPGDRIRVTGYENNGIVSVRNITRPLSLYYYRADADKDETGNVLCSESGLAPVAREVPLANATTTIETSIKLLIAGSLTAEEKAQGISTEYPLDGLALRSANLKDGMLTLSFADPSNHTSGGSCRAKILWLQVKATAQQFPGIREVRFSPEDLFQP